jgi:hypothetical protein
MDTAQLSRRGFILGVAGLAATAAAIRPGAALAATPPVVSGAAHFVLTRADGKAYTFTKLVSIISQVDSEELGLTQLRSGCSADGSNRSARHDE